MAKRHLNFKYKKKNVTYASITYDKSSTSMMLEVEKERIQAEFKSKFGDVSYWWSSKEAYLFASNLEDV